jgi:hypothetical protein
LAERRTIKEQKIEYEGLFKVRELYKLIHDWIFERGYDKNEVMHSEQVTEPGKNIHVIVEGIKKISDYVKYIIEFEINMSDIKEVVIKKENKTETYNQGKVSIELKAYFITDYENKWQQSPVRVFFRTLVDKFVLPLSEDKQVLVDELKHAANQIEGFLNLYRYAK